MLTKITKEKKKYFGFEDPRENKCDTAWSKEYCN